MSEDDFKFCDPRAALIGLHASQEHGLTGDELRDELQRRLYDSGGQTSGGEAVPTGWAARRNWSEEDAKEAKSSSVSNGNAQNGNSSQRRPSDAMQLQQDSHSGFASGSRH